MFLLAVHKILFPSQLYCGVTQFLTKIFALSVFKILDLVIFHTFFSKKKKINQKHR